MKAIAKKVAHFVYGCCSARAKASARESGGRPPRNLWNFRRAILRCGPPPPAVELVGYWAKAVEVVRPPGPRLSASVEVATRKDAGLYSLAPDVRRHRVVQ